MPHSDSTRDIAQFPKCPHCGAFDIAPVSDGPICFQQEAKPPVIIPRSQAAALVRFVSRTHGKVIAKHLYRALGDSDQYSRTLDTIWARYGELIRSDRSQKRRGPGSFATYSIGDGFRVWDPKDEAGDDDE